MIENASLIAGAQLFRSDDRPYYHRAWTVIVSIPTIGVAIACILIAVYTVTNRKIAQESSAQPGEEMVDGMSGDESATEAQVYRKALYNV